jgi:hypothetical protein
VALLLGGCSGGSGQPIPLSGNAGANATGSPGTAGSSPGTAGSDMSGVAGQTGTGGSSATTGQAGAGAPGTGGSTGGSTGAGTAGATGVAGATDGGSTGVAGSDAGSDDQSCDPPPPRKINVTPGGVYQGNGLRLDKSKPIMGKLILYLGGICGGTGAGGIESFVNAYGFHTYAPATQTCVNGGNVPQMYKDTIAKTPLDPEANRQIGDARMELWDGVDRVSFVTVAKGQSIVEETEAALKTGMMNDPGGDWGYFLNADGTLRTTDVWVVGYSWGSQTWAMISSYVRFGRVICTSGPQAEGFPNAAWITHPSATPNACKYTMLGFMADYPSTVPIDIAPNTVTSMIDTTTKAGWIGPPINVHPCDPVTGMPSCTAKYTAGHQIAMVGSNPHSPGGHTVFCTNDPMNGWIPICKYAFDVDVQ